MALEVDGKTIETTPMGYIVNQDDWTESVAEAIAKAEDLVLTDRHWDVINYLRKEYFENAGNQPNTRSMVKQMGKTWDAKIDAKVLYDLFPGDPSKQGSRVAGLPESRRKGGY